MDMLELAIKGLVTIYIVKLILKHSLFISKLIIKIKFLGIHIEVNSKEKKHPSSED
ncbi:membrane protein [Clostridium sp. K25]|nr:membrane protein [Clostridium botulinum C str. Stockholm]KEI07629.1 membrane protein [Clostridium sp. K25]